MPRSETEIMSLMAELQRTAQPFVLATVVRTVAATSAKAGAKAVVTAEGIKAGWVGGGCAQGAVRRAAAAALADGRSRLISVQPDAALAEEGHAPGTIDEGIEYHRSVCPSGGTLDIFIEPMLPRPTLVICGASPVAQALADLAPSLGFAVTLAALAGDQSQVAQADARIEAFDLPARHAAPRFIVVATQGKRDFDALLAALTTDAAYVAFVGSRRKMATLGERLVAAGISLERVGVVRSPAGLNIGAITPEEIALSILAEIVGERRKSARGASRASAHAA